MFRKLRNLTFVQQDNLRNVFLTIFMTEGKSYELYKALVCFELLLLKLCKFTTAVVILVFRQKSINLMTSRSNPINYLSIYSKGNCC